MAQLRTSLFIEEIGKTIKEAVEKFAMKHDLTYAQSLARARLRINGVEIPGVEIESIELEIGKGFGRVRGKKKAR